MPIITNETNEKSKDNLSSAITFAVCGVAGIVILLLNDFGILHLFNTQGSAGVFVNIVLGAMFLIFFGIAFICFRSSKTLQSTAQKEIERDTRILAWLQENISKEQIDAACDDSLAEEMKYFQRSNFIQEAILQEFNNLEPEMIESVSDNYIEQLYPPKC